MRYFLYLQVLFLEDLQIYMIISIFSHQYIKIWKLLSLTFCNQAYLSYLKAVAVRLYTQVSIPVSHKKELLQPFQ